MDKDELVLNRLLEKDTSERSRASFVVENMLPDAVFTPRQIEDVKIVVAEANRENLSVIPFGGGTRRNLGMPPTKYDIALNLKELNAVIHHNPDDLTISVQAGINLDSLQYYLLEHGQFLPLASPLSNLSTIGGILASDASGPIKWRYGHIRDLVIGMKFINSDGSIIKTGGNVVKNVTGYDIAKLHIGALGTLGIISEISLRLMPKPRVNHTIIVQIENMSLAINAVKAIFHSSLLPLALSLFTGNVAQCLGKSLQKDNAFIAVNIIGGPKSVVRQGQEVLQLCATGNPVNFEMLTYLEAVSFWKNLTDFGWQDSTSSISAVRVSTNFLNLDQLIQDLGKFVSEDGIAIGLILNPGFGTMDIHWQADEASIDLDKFSKYLQEVLKFLRLSGHRAIVERCPKSLKRQIDVWGEIPGGISLMHAIKNEYDPNRIFNPGRFVAGI